MDRYKEALQLIEEACGNGKDNVISLATIAEDPDNKGQMCPYTRDVDAYYEDGVFYVSTWGESNKMRQIAKHEKVAFSVHYEGISGIGIAENLGWVLDPKNAEIRTKLRHVFRDWYDDANNEQNENCIVLAIRMTKGTIFRDHGMLCYHLDFIKQREVTE